MAREQRVQKIRNLLGQILDLPSDSIGGDDHIMNDLGGDSWHYLEFRTELERVFSIIIPDEEVDRLATVDETLELISEFLDRETPGQKEDQTEGTGV